MRVEYESQRTMRDPYAKSERHGDMQIDWNAPIRMADGITLRADIFRPVAEGRYPVVLSYGVYAKGLSYQQAYPQHWNKMIADYPEILEGSTNQFQNWEVTDPERWVPDGYVVIRVDSRGAGWSEGVLNPGCPTEIDDVYECIEWAGTQSWSNGKVGMLGISYYSINQWKVAARHPPHLAAIIPWEGCNDNYRDGAYHGGIRSEFTKRWAKVQLSSIQYGLGERARKSPFNGMSIAGPITLSDEELERNRRDPYLETKKHPLCDEWHRECTPDLAKITVPLLSCANWGGHGIHPRGNFNGFVQASSEQKWLEGHGDSHWSLFSAGYGVSLQKRFFDHFLKGVDNGWEKTPRVQLNIRYPGERFVPRGENEWPLARTLWTKLYCDQANMSLRPDAPAAAAGITYDAMGDGLLFSLPPAEFDREFTGPFAAKLFISSSTSDADLFVVIRLFDPDGTEVTFQGCTDPNTPIAFGWLRASHRRLDPIRSNPYQPWHPHDRVEPLTPGEIYECDVEILPTCIVVPAGFRLALAIRGKDYEYTGPLTEFAKTFVYATRGTGGMTHADPEDRPVEVFAGKVTLHVGGKTGSYLLAPLDSWTLTG